MEQNAQRPPEPEVPPPSQPSASPNENASRQVFDDMMSLARSGSSDPRLALGAGTGFDTKGAIAGGTGSVFDVKTESEALRKLFQEIGVNEKPLPDVEMRGLRVPKTKAEGGSTNEIRYPNGHVRTLQRDQNGDVTDIVTKGGDGKQLSHYVKDGGKWYYETPEGMRAKVEGDIKVSPKGDVSFETSPSTWRTERTDGTTQMERSNADGSRVAFTKDGKPERITRKDGSSVEATYKNGELTGVTETDKSGKMIAWTRRGDHFESQPPGQEQRKNVQLDKNGNYSFDSSDGFKYTVTGDGAKLIDDLGLTTKRDAKGRVEQITYPGGKKTRTFGRDEQGNVNAITTRDEHGERTYVKDGNKWFLQMDGMNIKLQGDIQVNARGDVSFEAKPGVWSTERTNGQIVRETSLDNGARVSMNRDGKVDKITRKDGSMVEATYNAEGKATQITEYSADGSKKTNWLNKGDHWESYPPGQPNRKNIQLLPSGIMVAESANGSKNITLGDGKQLLEQPGNAHFSFDQQGRFESISYPNGETLKFSYDEQGLKQIVKERDGKPVRINTRTGENRWEVSNGEGKKLGRIEAEYKVNSNGELNWRDLNKQKNPDGYWTVITTDGQNHKEKINGDGSRVIKNSDRTTVEVDRDGLVRKVSTSKDNYRTFEYDNHGKVSKVTDYRKGKEASSWEPAKTPDRTDVKVRDNGDVTYRTKGGAVIERANFAKIELDKGGHMTKVTQPNGNTREFKYETLNGKQELVGITDTRHNGKELSTESWARKKNSDGSFADTFVSGEGKNQRERKDVVIGRDGDYQYKTGDGKLHIARAGRDNSGGLSESVDEARERFMESLEGKMDEKRAARMREMMKEYEKRMSDRVEAQVAGGKDEATARSAVEKTIAGTYDQLSGLVTPTDADASGQYFNQQQRVKLAENFMFLAQNPLEANQGNHGTCWMESGWISGGMVQHGDHMARLLKEVSLTGKYTTLNGGLYGGGPKTFSFSRELFNNPNMEGMYEEKYWTIDRAHVNEMVPGVPQTYATARSPVGMIFDQVLPVVGGRPEGSSTGGNFESNPNARYMDGRPVTDGSQNIMYMVTGDKIEIEREHNADPQRERQILLEKGAVCDSPPGHLRTRQLKKVGDSWYVIQDDQHGDQNDQIMYKIRDLKQWMKERPEGNVQLHRDFAAVGDTTIGGMQGGRSEGGRQPGRYPQQQPYWGPRPSPYRRVWYR